MGRFVQVGLFYRTAYRRIDVWILLKAQKKQALLDSNMFPSNASIKHQKIFAAEKIIADISSGLYRSPAAALKELISNAHDADASQVVIDTSPPHFNVLVIRDNGDGMLLDDFLEHMKHIGGSKKRIVKGDTTKTGRKIIGRIGIGMLAVAQLGFRFYVSSTIKGSAKRFIAEVNLEPFHKDDAALKSMGRFKADGKVDIGAVAYIDDLDERKDTHYTVITIPDVKKGIIAEMTGNVRDVMGTSEELDIRKHKAKSFREVIEVMRRSRRADASLDGYYYMLWELGLLSPVNYVDEGPFQSAKRNIENASEFKSEITENFQLFVDGIEIRRPQLFPSACAWRENYSGLAPFVHPFVFDKDIAGHQLKYYGYVYVQRPRIDPEEFKGLHIRIRNVGIGTYDKSWMGYPFDEGIKFGQVSGELFVQEGLESALNIDRDSFMETHVHYQAMRAHVWHVLRNEVFPEFKKRASDFRAYQKRKISEDKQQQFHEQLSELPAPFILEGFKKVSDIQHPALMNVIGIDADNLLIDNKYWNEIVNKHSLSTSEQDRLRKVIIVLLSSEILSTVPDDEIDAILNSFAEAIK